MAHWVSGSNGNEGRIKQTRSQNDTQLTHNKNGMKQAALLEAILPAELLLHFLSKNGVHETRRTIGSNRSAEEKDVRLRPILYAPNRLPLVGTVVRPPIAHLDPQSSPLLLAQQSALWKQIGVLLSNRHLSACHHASKRDSPVFVCLVVELLSISFYNRNRTHSQKIK